MRVEDARRMLLSRDDLERGGAASRALAREVAAGRLRLVDHGWYADADAWAGMRGEEQHLVRVVAADSRRRGSGDVVSHTSAAVLHGLPLFQHQPHRVHLSGSKANGRVRASEPIVARHELLVSEADRVDIEGITCTSLARTVADVMRLAPRETAIALADAAFRRVAWNDSRREYDSDLDARFRADVMRRLPRGGRGVKQARMVLELADGRAQLPGESVSRLYLLDLGFAPPRLQVPVPGPTRQTYYVDFGLDDADAWGEFDGKGKYLDPDVRGPVSIEDALLAEKSREDWIRGTTNRRFARWGFEHIRSALTLRARLGAFGIHPR